MRRILLLPAILLLVSLTAIAQENTPTLTGKMILSIKKGTMECDFTLSDIPQIADYSIRINSGLNVLNLRFAAPGNDRIIYPDKTTNETYESSGYYFKDNTGKGKFLPPSFRVTYRGMFNVVPDTLNNYSYTDWKGNIAFNGYSVRADGFQTAWYPILYDKTKDILYDKLKYDIEVECSDCTTIYINGSTPVSGQKARLKSEKPVQMSLFSGDFKVADMDGAYFLNPDMNEPQIKEFGNLVRTYKAYYAKQIGIPYDDKITFVHTTPTTNNRAWLFVTFPTIFNIGWSQYGMNKFLSRQSLRAYLAHELGHYYFGTYKIFNSGLGDMMTEGFSEYLALKILKKMGGDSLYRKKIKEKTAELKTFIPVSFANIKSISDYQHRNLYVYTYAPMIFTAIEAEIGEEAMWKWMHKILTTPTDFTNYTFLEKTLGAVLNNDKKMEDLRKKYLSGDQSKENMIAALQNDL